jgi:hypothetical protein
MSKPGQFLITLSGGRTDILEHCPGERIRFQSLGWVILITSGMAVVSMWFALTSALGVHAYAALPLALLWGLVIMGIDRWLVTSLPYDRTRKWFIAAPRLALAILLGSLISTPIVLRVFQSEINNQISVIKQENAANFIASQQRSTVQQQVAKWQATVTNLNKVIDSGGQAPINPGSDPTVQGLTKQMNAAQAQANKDYTEWKCELYGGHCGAPKGNGPLAQATHRRYQADLAQVSALQTRIKGRESALQANDQASQQIRLQQAQQQLPEAKAQLTLAQNRETALANGFDATNESTNGLLIRLQALDQLTAKGGSLSVVRWLLFLLFLVIEVLPVMVKLLTPPGQYEAILRTANQHELRRATWALRSEGSSAAANGPADGFGVPVVDQSLRPTVRDGGHHAHRQPRDMSPADLLKLFQRTTEAKVPPGPGPESGWSPTQRSPIGPDTTSPNLLDEDLRDLADARPGSGLSEQFGDQRAPGDAYDDPNSGIERRYGEDDL